MDGKKLAPFIVFKGEEHGRLWKEWKDDSTRRANGYPVNGLYGVQKKAWMDRRLMDVWMKSVWSDFVRDECDGRPTYLLMDEFRAHMVSEVCAGLQEEGTEVDFITPGFTGALQVLDVGVNKQFKQYIRHQYEEWMVDNPLNQRPTRPIVATWIHNAWDTVSIDAIVNTWRSVGYVASDDYDEDDDSSYNDNV
jgi:hypothetical protein